VDSRGSPHTKFPKQELERYDSLLSREKGQGGITRESIIDRKKTHRIWPEQPREYGDFHEKKRHQRGEAKLLSSMQRRGLDYRTSTSFLRGYMGTMIWELSRGKYRVSEPWQESHYGRLGRCVTDRWEELTLAGWRGVGKNTMKTIKRPNKLEMPPSKRRGTILQFRGGIRICPSSPRGKGRFIGVSEALRN